MLVSVIVTHVPKPLLNVTVLRIAGQSFLELVCRGFVVSRGRQRVALIQIAAHNLLPQHLPRQKVLGIGRDQPGSIGSREQRLFHLALLAQLQGDLIPVSRHLLVLFGDSLGLVLGKRRQRQEKQQDGASPLHREVTFYLYSERFPEVCLRSLPKFLERNSLLEAVPSC